MEVQRSFMFSPIALAICLATAATAFSQATQTPPAKADPAPAGAAPAPEQRDRGAPVTPVKVPDATKPNSPVALKIVKAECGSYRRVGKDKPDVWNNTPCALGKTVFVTFANLDDWVKDGAANPKNKVSDLVLVLDGRVMRGLPSRGPEDPNANELLFDLKRLDLVADDDESAANRKAWDALLGNSKLERYMKVGVAIGGNPTYLVAPDPVSFQVFSTSSIFYLVTVLVLLVIFLLLGKNSDMLRDAPSPAPEKKTPWWTYLSLKPSTTKESFSLARCQMAWWFFIILGTYLYIWIVCQDRDSLTAGALTLMGISAATGFGSFLVDSSKSDQRTTLTDEQAALAARIAQLKPLIAADAAPENLTDLTTELRQKTDRLADVNTAIGKLPSPIGLSNGFFVDILRDETGISFHRFQMAAWTLILGCIFIVAVYRTLAMPDFSATLLGLMGISAGTYVGFKIPAPPK